MFWLAHGIAHGLFALILDWSKQETSKLYYFAFVFVTFNPNRCNGDFLTRLISRASPRLQNFFAISDWLMDCLRSFWLVKAIFWLLFLGHAIQSGAIMTFARFFSRFPSATYFVTDCFLFVVFLCSLWLVKVNYFAFVPATLNWNRSLRHSTYTHVLESLLMNLLRKACFTMLLSAPQGKWFTPLTKTSNLERSNMLRRSWMLFSN